MGNPEDKVRVMRIIEYVGPRSWVEGMVEKSIQGTRHVGTGKTITAVTIGTYPEILEFARVPRYPKQSLED